MLKLKVLNQLTSEIQEAVLTPTIMSQGEYLIGRASSCDLVLDSQDVSRVHGRIKYQNAQYHYTDLGSANGSRINQEDVQVNRNYGLSVDDVIRIGDFVLFVETVETIDSSALNGKSIAADQLSSDRPWNDDLTVRCVRIIHETPDVKTFTFIAESPILFNYKPGQFVTLNLNINGEDVLRSYSISSAPSRPHTLEITVKRVPAPSQDPEVPPGLVSNWLHDNLQIGSQLKLSKPMGKFTCYPQPAAKLLLISAGSGITPMMSMARWIADTTIASDIIFFHSARSSGDIIFRQELEMMATRLPNFRLAISTTRPELGQPWFGFTGRLNEVLLQSIAPDFRDRTIYVCGPAGFMQGIKTLVEGLDFPMSNYYEERFGGPKSPTSKDSSGSAKESSGVQVGDRPDPPVSSRSAPASTRPVVVFAQSKQEITSDGTESVLELAEQAGIKIRSSCKQGVCGVCKKQKLEGEVRYESEPDALGADDQAAGFILPCIATPIQRVVVEA
jgi:ferredoxin-NADP reductase